MSKVKIVLVLLVVAGLAFGAVKVVKHYETPLAPVSVPVVVNIPSPVVPNPEPVLPTKPFDYLVQAGDTIASIAEKFKVSVNTILWENNLTAKSILKLNDKLVILPCTGVTYKVKGGDTLLGIANSYKVETDKILTANQLTAESKLQIGQILIIPDGVKKTVTATVAATKKVTTAPKATTSSGVTWTSGALQKLYRVPSRERAIVKRKMTDYAITHGIKVITAEVYDEIHV